MEAREQPLGGFMRGEGVTSDLGCRRTHRAAAGRTALRRWLVLTGVFGHRAAGALRNYG